MSVRQDRLNIIQDINLAAKLYKQNLVGKKFLYIFEGRYIEVVYKRDSFKHLTGVESNLSASRFYQSALQNRLTTNQIFFSPQHPFRLCQRKIKHIKEISTLAVSECFMLEDISTHSRTYKFGTTDLQFTLCFDQPRDCTGVPVNEVFTVQSLRDEDCFKRSQNVYSVSFIFSKSNDEKFYSSLLFRENSTSLSAIPLSVKDCLKPELLHE